MKHEAMANTGTKFKSNTLKLTKCQHFQHLNNSKHVQNA